MIIVEGTDKSGKSTLIKNLREYMFRIGDIRIKHWGLLPSDFNYLEDYIKFIDNYDIFDRFIDSELVYGPVYRGCVNKSFTKKNQYLVYEALKKRGTLVIYCNPSIKSVINRIELESDELIKNKKQLIKLRKGFDKLYSPKNNYPLRILELDTTYPIEKKQYENIINLELKVINELF